MKIGEVSTQFSISKDTIRYYINEGLIIPKRKGSLLEFGKTELDDIEFIQRLKAMGFSIQDIMKIIATKRIGNEKDTQYLMAYGQMLDKITAKTHEDIHEAYMRLGRIEEENAKIQRMKSDEADYSGVPLNSLEILICPKCEGKLRIENAQIITQGIFYGDVKCSCGYAIHIKDGILITGNEPTTKYDRPDLSRGLSMLMTGELATIHQKAYNKVTQAAKAIGLDGKVVLESNLNSAFLIYSYYKDLDKGKLYIFIDKYFDVLLMYKRCIDKLNLNLNILYIADDSTDFPIKKQSVDIFVDAFASNTHSLYSHKFLPREMAKFLKPTGVAVGSVVYFDEGSPNHENIPKTYPEVDRTFHYRKNFEKQLTECYSDIHIEDLGYVKNTPKGRYLLGCHIDGERWNVAAYIAKK